MKIFIQGRKRGYSVLYPFPTPDEFYNFAMDIQSINAQNQPFYYGKSFYSIAFTKGGRIFTKYVLGYDVQRSNLGNISISLYIPDQKRLLGEKIIEALNTLISTYFDTYAPNYHIGDKSEDWSLFTKIANQYDGELLSIDNLDVDHIERGKNDAGYIYYKDINQLKDYFDEPYQSCYEAFSQVFLIDQNLKNEAANPLNAFKHSADADLTGKIDLSNKKYRYVINDTAHANIYQLLEDGSKKKIAPNERILRKSEIIIEWKKDYYEPITKTGFLDQLISDLELDENNRRISVKPATLKLQERVIQYSFRVAGKDIKPDIICSNQNGITIEIDNGKIRFEGQQIYENWYLKISYGKFVSKEISFIPNNTNYFETINLEEEGRYSIKVIDKTTNYNIPNPDVYILQNGKSKRKCDSRSLNLKGSELDEKISIEASARKYTTETITITPRNTDSNIVIELKPDPRKVDKDIEWNDYDNNSGHQHPKRSWFKRNLVAIIVSTVLLLSLATSIIINIKLSHDYNSLFIKAANECLQGTRLLSNELSDYLEYETANNDQKTVLALWLETAKTCRSRVDKCKFDIGEWNKEQLSGYNIPELVRFYDICIKNRESIEGMQTYLKDKWKDKVNEHPLREICIEIEWYLKHDSQIQTEQVTQLAEDVTNEEEAFVSSNDTIVTSDNNQPNVKSLQNNNSRFSWLSKIFRRGENK